VVITGTNFTNVSAVQMVFNQGMLNTTYTVNSSTQITATVPSNAPIGSAAHLKVTTSAGNVTSSGTFTVTSGGGGGGGGSAPTITNLSPTSGPGGTVVTITGTNFTNVQSVALVSGTRSLAVSYTVDSSTQIRATMPGGVAAGAAAHIKVTTTNGSVTSSGSYTFT
jgi:hypothetical protein